MQKIAWPEIRERYNQALRSAVDYIFQRYHPAGMIAAGSIVRGVPDRSSDIDLYVIHLEPYRQRVQKFFNGVPVEIFINPPHQVERYMMQEQADGRPITAHMLSTGVLLFENDPVIAKLRKMGEELLQQKPVYSQTSLLFARYLAGNIYEDALDLVEKDAPVANLLLERSVNQMIEYFYRYSGHFLPRVKETLSKLNDLDPQTAQLARQFFSAASLEQRLALAAELAERTIAVNGFFEWESEPEQV
jgi:predicted nucleotidyltransferase